MAVPQLQLANLGEIFAQNQAKQAAMDTMQLQQAEALAARDARIEKANREKLLREKLATGEVNLQSPEGFNQLLNMGVITPDQYLSANETLAAIAKNKAQGEAATLKAEIAQQKLALDRENIQSQIQNRTEQLKLSSAQEARLLRQFKQDTDKTEFEAALKFAQTITGVPEEQRPEVHSKLQSQYGDLFPRLFEGGYTPEVGVIVQALANSSASQAPLSNVAKIEEDFRKGRLSQQQRDAAIAKATTTKGTRTTINPSTGAVVIEEGGMPVGGAQTSIGVTPQQSSILQDIEEIQSIASGEKGPVAEFFATGAPSITGALGAFTPGGYTEKKLDTVVSNLTLDKLQQIRMASPTGAALGNASDKDVALLKASAGTLNQSQKQEDFLRNISKVKDQYKDTVSGTPSQIVSATLSGKVNVFDAADAIKRDNPQNYTLSVPSLDVIQNLPPALQSAMSGMQVRDQQTGQTITINAPPPSGGGQGGVISFEEFMSQ
jgi:hypothetical protein